MKSLDELEHAIEYRFRQQDLLLQAVTHRSYAHEQRPTVRDNERLEFLGDSILGLLISETLFHQRPNLDEGQLSKLRAFLVSSANLVHCAEQIRLGDYLRLGKGEEKSGGRAKQALLVNGFEAVIAAVYLDGGLRPVKKVLGRFFEQQIEDVAQTADRVSDFKSALQERLQASRAASAEYCLLDERGPDHRKRFTVEVRIDGQPAVRGIGLTKKAAEQAAAMRAIQALSLLDAGSRKPLAGRKTEEI